MSNVVDNNRYNNVNRELTKKQIMDSVSLFVSLILIYACASLLQKIGYEFIGILTIIFIALMAVQEYGKARLKKVLNATIFQTLNQTTDEINSILKMNKTQKENNDKTSLKLEDTKALLSNLKLYSDSMKKLTLAIQEKTDKSLEFTNGEYNSVKTNIEKMFSIRHKIQTIAELILELSDFVQSISSTIGLVEDIAEQTNLLALNAAVEAARAGEHGKGFAVVASEIRKLADESKQATAKIISLVNDIQQTANSTVLATEEGTKEIESGLELAHLISENIEQLISSMNEISDSMKEVMSSSDKISVDSNNAEQRVDEFSQLVEDSKKIIKDNDFIFAKIENTTTEFKDSIL